MWQAYEFGKQLGMHKEAAGLLNGIKSVLGTGARIGGRVLEEAKPFAKNWGERLVKNWHGPFSEGKVPMYLGKNVGRTAKIMNFERKAGLPYLGASFAGLVPGPINTALMPYFMYSQPKLIGLPMLAAGAASLLSRGGNQQTQDAAQQAAPVMNQRFYRPPNYFKAVFGRRL